MEIDKEIDWHKALSSKHLLQEGRVKTVSIDHRDICLTNVSGKYCALANRCPHQGGPLGDGSIENGLLRCPWHGWDFDPCTGKAPGGFDDGVETYPVKEIDSAIYVGLPKIKPHLDTVSDLMIETMINWGVDTVFGMVGHSNLGIADAMRRQEKAGNLRYFGIRHEGAAAFAASGYAKLSGKPAACFGIAGPGATNMYTGMWDAKVDRVPLLALTGQVNTQVLGTGAFQEVDLVKAFLSVAEFNHSVQLHSNHSELMAQAIKHALVKRDVSHLTFPDEVAFSPKPENTKAQDPDHRITPFNISPPAQMVDRAITLIESSTQPIIIVGHGARFQMEEIIKLAEKLKCPLITTFKGKGLVGDNHALGCGVLGRSGTPIASWFMNEADLVIVFGASFSNHTGISPKKPIIQVDFDPMALSKFHKVDVALWGEISETVRIFLTRIRRLQVHDQRTKIAERWKIWRAEKEKRLKEKGHKGISSIAVINAFNQVVEEDAIIAVDVGNNTYSFGRYFESTRQSILMSGYLGSIGFALPAAIGAWAAQGDQRPVWSFSGDGGLGQYMAEMTTLVKYEMNIKHIVLNNGELAKISKEQRAAQLDVWHTSLHNPSFAGFAENCGALGIRVDRIEMLLPALQQIRDHQGPALLEVITDPGLI
ncbi:MAG: Rieske 2Fe-2S domain-containing protein [Saprospiraceae bacterium]|nr:Rieske 2Fe-2S domain-containing protein [Saprospiraceae bacterium]